MDREQQILALIRPNPFISQHEMAGIIGSPDPPWLVILLR